MKAEIFFAPFARALKEEFHYGDARLAVRRGLALKMETAAGPVFSEASPLTSHSSDDPAVVFRSLQMLSSTELWAHLEEGGGNLPPSLRFGLEGLLMQLNPGKFHALRSNALAAWEGAGKTTGRIALLERAGFTHLKLKLPSENWEELAGVLQEFPALRFRLDANGALDAKKLDQLIGLLSRAGLCGQIDYLEEPFANVWREATFADLPLALAADESASSPGAARALLEGRRAPDVFILKPTVLGGLCSLAPLAAELAQAGKRAVFTSCLETEFGRRALLAFLGREARDVCGLATGFLFNENFLADQPLWQELPPVPAAELAYRESLAWRRSGC